VDDGPVLADVRVPGALDVGVDAAGVEDGALDVTSGAAEARRRALTTSRKPSTPSQS
jgi:hypothetical protein